MERDEQLVKLSAEDARKLVRQSIDSDFSNSLKGHLEMIKEYARSYQRRKYVCYDGLTDNVRFELIKLGYKVERGWFPGFGSCAGMIWRPWVIEW